MVKEKKTTTGDNQNFGGEIQNPHACKHCGGNGQIMAAPVHQGLKTQGVVLQNHQTKQNINMPWLTQFPFQAGTCPKCLGSGEAHTPVLKPEDYGKTFTFLKHMADHWKGDAAVKKDIEKMRKEVKKHETSADAPTREGLAIILRGTGLNDQQAETVINAVAGYTGLLSA